MAAEWSPLSHRQISSGGYTLRYSHWDSISRHIDLYYQKDVLGAFASKTIGELEKDIGGIGGLKQLLLYITEDDPVVKAFEIMQKYNIHGVPVLSKDGQIIGNISASDMKVPQSELHILLILSTAHCQTRSRSIEGISSPILPTCQSIHMHFTDWIPLQVNPDHSPVIKCTTSSTFLEMLTQLVEKKVHRTYVVDAEGKPVDIITLTNILHAIDLFATKKPSN